jgi:hypothetical protein
MLQRLVAPPSPSPRDPRRCTFCWGTSCARVERELFPNDRHCAGGGLGTRLRGVLPDLPTTLAPGTGAPFWPMCWTGSARMATAPPVGREHLHERIEALPERTGRHGRRYSFETEPLGTGGGGAALSRWRRLRGVVTPTPGSLRHPACSLSPQCPPRPRWPWPPWATCSATARWTPRRAHPAFLEKGEDGAGSSTEVYVLQARC